MSSRSSSRGADSISSSQQISNSSQKYPHHQRTPQQSQSSQIDYASSQKQKYNKSVSASAAHSVASHSHYSLNHSHQQHHFSGIDSDSQTRELYENQIPVRVRSNDREDHLTYLTLKIMLKKNPQSTSAVGQGQQLQIELTDEGNQFACILELSGGSGTDGNLKVTETNQFKSLVHLSLRFTCANDEVLKTYLADKLSKERGENEDLRIKCSRLSDTLSDAEVRGEDLAATLKSIEFENSQQLEQLQIDHAKKLHLLKEELLQRESDLRNSLESKHSAALDQVQTQLSEQRKLNAELQNNNQELLGLKLANEANIRELTTKLTIADKELTATAQELGNTRAENKNLDALRFAHEKKITELTVKLDAAEHAIKDKESINSNSKDIISAAEERKKHLERELNEKAIAIEKAAHGIESSKEEIERNNQKIEDLREKLSKKKSKVTLKKIQITELESTLATMTSQVESLRKDLNEVHRERDELELKSTEEERTNNDLKQKLQDASKLLEQNQAMIQYLNNQLNNNGSSAASALRPPTGSSNYIGSSTLPRNPATSNIIPSTVYSIQPNRLSGTAVGATTTTRSLTPLMQSNGPSDRHPSSLNTQYPSRVNKPNSISNNTEENAGEQGYYIGKYSSGNSQISSIPGTSSVNNHYSGIPAESAFGASQSYSTSQQQQFTKSKLYTPTKQLDSDVVIIAPIKYRDPTKTSK